MIVNISDKGILNKTAVRKFFESLEPGRWDLQAKKFNKRSNQQNRYLWGVVYTIVLEGLKDMGFDEVKTVEHVHIICKNLFLKVMMPDKNGVALEFIKSTSELDKEEMGEYIENIARWAAEYLSVTIPAPNEQVTIFDNRVAHSSYPDSYEP